MGLEPAANGEDRVLQLGRDALDDVACSGQVVQASGAELEIATPPLVKPGLGATQRPADELHGATGEAERNGTLACHEFVVHGNLRGAAASGCPRRALYHVAAAQTHPQQNERSGQPSANPSITHRSPSLNPPHIV